jgi:stage IV sporulation protein B
MVYTAKCTRRLPKFYHNEPMSICYQHDVHTGKASILTTVDDSGIREFDIQIKKINYQQAAEFEGNGD